MHRLVILGLLVPGARLLALTAHQAPLHQRLDNQPVLIAMLVLMPRIQALLLVILVLLEPLTPLLALPVVQTVPLVNLTLRREELPAAIAL